MTVPTDLDYARGLDEQDELAAFRGRFVIDDPELVYLDGNSLGRLPKQSLERARELVAQQWGRRLIRSWNEHWFDLPRRVGAKIARVVGAGDDEVVVADSTSVNLFKLVLAALRAPATRGRSQVVTDDLNFPTDLYILRSAVELAGPGYDLHVVSSADGIHVPTDALAEAVDSSTAVVALSHTAYKSGWVYDMPAVTDLAHRAGALTLWDLSHSAGAVPLDLSAAAADLAVGCTYKYLNGGPGAPAYLYVRRELQESFQNPIAGWFGHADPFAFTAEYEPAACLARFLTGTPPVISLALIEPGVDLVLEAGLQRLRAKAMRQTEYLIGLWEVLLAPLGFDLGSPRDPDRRGSHVALLHTDGLRIARALIDQMQVIPDFRVPDTLRFGVCPLYTTYVELHTAVTALQKIAQERGYRHYSPERGGVT
jgi:kynureninase